MSQSRTQDRIELQRYFSETSSILSGPNTTVTTMSTSGSFTGSTQGPTAQQHTDADERQNPTYFSIPEAQGIHQQYRASQQPSNASTPVPVPVPGPASGHAPLGNGHTEQPSETQYEFIRDTKSKYMQGSHSYQPSGGVTMQAENILYEETEQALRHQTLTMDKQKYRGSLTPDPLEVKSGGGACKRACLVLLVFVLCVAVLVALVVGVLSLVILFTGLFNVCTCTTAVVDSSSIEVQSLIARIQTLEMELDLLMMRTTEPPVTSSTVARTTMSVTTPPTTDVTTADNMVATTPMPTSPDLPMAMEGVVTLSGVDLFQNCSSSVEETCTVQVGTGEGTGACATDPLVPLTNTQGFALNMNCIRSAPSAEANPLIATLEVFPEGAGCICSVPDLNAVNRLQPVECGLLVTRCTVPTNITATLLSN